MRAGIKRWRVVMAVRLSDCRRHVVCRDFARFWRKTNADAFVASIPTATQTPSIVFEVERRW